MAAVLLAMPAAAAQKAADISSPAKAGEEKSAAGKAVPRVLVAAYSGIITPVAAEYFEVAVEKAEAGDYDALVIELDTPGGLDLPMREIVKEILGSDVPVIVYVSPSGARAASAGVFITMAAHVAAMTPGTNIGAAHPVPIGKPGFDPPSIGKDKDGKKEEKKGGVMEAKVTQDAGAYLQAIATRRGRNAALAMEMVSKSTSIISADAAARGIVDLEAKDLETLLETVHGRTLKDFAKPLNTKGAQIESVGMTLRQRILAAVSDPNIAMLLMSLGGAGLLIELYNPGLILPGVVGAVALVLAFYSFQTLSASYAGLLLIGLGFLFLMLEIKITSFGLLALSGTAAVVFGAMMLFKDGMGGVAVSYTAIASAVITMLAIVGVLIYIGKNALLRKPAIGLEDVKGEIGTAKSALAPDGTVFWHGELWKARSVEGEIPEGSEVVVEKAEGLVLSVRRRGGTD